MSSTGSHDDQHRVPNTPGNLAEATFCEPMLAHSGHPGVRDRGGPLAGGPGEWLFEPKLDGLRAIAVRNGAKVSLLSRNRLSWDARFPAIVAALGALPATNFVLDGEVVGLVGGWPDFAALQQGKPVPVEYWVFDLPWLLGHDLRHLAIEERKSLLARTVNNTPGLAIVESLKGAPTELFDKACAEGWEGLVAKRSGSHYREGRSADWRKLKCGSRQEFVVAGFTEPRGSRDGFGALLLGYWEGGTLMYAGKVGAGFTHENLGCTIRPAPESGAGNLPFRRTGARTTRPLGRAVTLWRTSPSTTGHRTGVSGTRASSV